MADVCDGLLRHLCKLREVTTEFDAVSQLGGSWKAYAGLTEALTNIRQAADLVRDTSTKFSLVMSSKPSSAAAKSITDELRKACDTLVAALGMMLKPACGASGPLVTIYSQQVRSVLRATEDLLRSGSAVAFQDSAPKTGVIWHNCDQIAKLPKSNKVAYTRAMLQHQMAVRDTVREFKELLEQAEAAGHNGDGADAECDDHVRERGGDANGHAHGDMDELADDLEAVDLLDEGFYGEDKALKAWEMANVERCVGVFKHCGGLIRTAWSLMGEAGDSLAESEATVDEERVRHYMAAVAGVERASGELSAAVTDTADALYSPQVPDELSGQLKLLDERAKTLLALLRRSLLPDVPGDLAKCDEMVAAVCEVLEGGVSTPVSKQAHGVTRTC